MIHWPRETGKADENWKERDLETYAKMEKLAKAGKARYLGLSNFLPHHLKNILEHCEIHPAVDQLELHPGYSQEAAAAFCQRHQVLPMAWSPFGRGRQSVAGTWDILAPLAKKYGKSVQQVSLRFLLQKGVLPIPKAASAEHIRANLEVFDFQLTEDEISMISCMPQTAWLGEHPDFHIPIVRSNPNQDA